MRKKKGAQRVSYTMLGLAMRELPGDPNVPDAAMFIGEIPALSGESPPGMVKPLFGSIVGSMSDTNSLNLVRALGPRI